MVVGVSAALLALGMTLALALRADSPTTRPNLQSVGLVLMLIGLTGLVVVFTIRDPAGRR